MKEYEICLSHYENYEEGEENRERERENRIRLKRRGTHFLDSFCVWLHP